ncbi:large ribosomal subunit protein bL19m-like isoform X2 [Hyperolius riggenbachi]|uniref:large ribosomal subunit protein bL19m-like isoform X2 n=1 Tax=Hyperolius riggenbachi TaxID=752182 RepID=UPI0035A2E5FA
MLAVYSADAAERSSMAACRRSLLLARYRTGLCTPARLLSDGEPTKFQPPTKPLFIDKEAQTAVRKKYLSPEFIPRRCRKDPLCFYLERNDMFERRKTIEIPEFYVGSILAVTMSDPHNGGNLHRFVGLCIQRSGGGLGATFTLRNVIEGQGVEMRYDMYSPRMQEIKVLKLEKRLDDNLMYLRDALPEYSTVDVNMQPVVLYDTEVPVNPIQVAMKPRPWSKRWEQHKFNIKGIRFEKYLLPRHFERAKKSAKPWDEFDMLKEYDTTKIEQDILQELESREKQSKPKQF